MITDRWMRNQQAFQQENARDQLRWLDHQYGVGPWGQSLIPQAQQMRDDLALQADDPQAFNRRLAQATAKRLAPEDNTRPNLFERRDPFTRISTPGQPAGSMSFSYGPGLGGPGMGVGPSGPGRYGPGLNSANRFPNPFS